MLDARDVVVRFRKGLRREPIVALNGLTIHLTEGDFLALIGENGAGKSTAMYTFLGLIRPSKGTVTLFGQKPEPGSAIYRRIGYLPEEPHYHLYLTVEEAVRYYGSLVGTRPPRARVLEILERLGLSQFRSLRLSKCSKGMKQKVGIAQCLLHKPALLFLDEPMRGLDPIIVREFRDMLADLHRQGVTIVMNSHILSEVEALATRVAILDRGKVVRDDAIGNLTEPGRDLYEVEFEGVDGAPPAFLNVQTHAGESWRASFPADSYHAFNEYVRDRGMRVVSCALKRTSLEDSFLAIVREGEKHA